MSNLSRTAPKLSKFHWKRPDLVHTVLDGSSLTVVRAPVGAGKTDLLAEAALMAACDAANKVVFIHGEAINQLSSGVVWEVGAAELGAPTDDATATASRERFFRAVAATKERIYLFIDDSSFLTREDTEFILLLLRTFRNVSVVASSQTRSPLETPRMMMVSDLSIIDAEQLAFTRGEVGDYLRHHVPAISDALVDTVYANSHGNVAMTKSAVQHLTQAGVSDLPAALTNLVAHMHTSSGVVDLEAALQDDDFADFILQVSVVDSFSQKLARTLTGRSDVSTLLARAEQLGLGAWAAFSPSTFTFSPLVLDALSEVRRLRLSDRTIAAAVRTAVQVLVDEGEPAAALLTALKGRDYALADDVLMGNSDFILALTPEALLPIIQWVPDTVADRYPELGCLAAISLGGTSNSRARSIDILSRSAAAARSLRDRSDPFRDALLYTTEGTALRKSGRPARALEVALKSAELLEVVYTNSGKPISSRADFASISNAASMMAAGAFEEALQPLIAVAENGSSKPMRTLANALLAAIAALCGDLVTADRAASNVAFGPSFAEDGSIFAGTASFMITLYEAVRAVEMFDLERASDLLFSVSGTTFAEEYWSTVATVQGFIDLLSGTPRVGIARLQASRTRHSAESLTVRTRAMLDYTEQLMAAALGENLNLDEFRDNLDMRTATAIQLLSYGRGLFHAGKLGPALRVLARVHKRKDVTVRVRAEALALEAAILLRFDAADDLAGVLGKLVATLYENGSRVSLALLSMDDAAALAEAEELAGESGLNALLREVRSGPLQLTVITPLSAREQQILEQLKTKDTLAEIGERLFISENTVRTHVKSIYKKLGVSKRQDALGVAGVRGLFNQS